MPLYEFRCQFCGPFDLRRDMRDAADTTGCPGCARPARRVYSVASLNPPSRSSRDATKTERARIDRARSGEPVLSGPPSGRRLPRPGGHQH